MNHPVIFKKLGKNNLKQEISVYSSKKYTEIYKKKIGSFILIEGKYIYYQKKSGIKDANFTAYVLSNVFAYLLYQRGNLVVHASALNINKKSFFFSGRSGSGKSTLVSNLLKKANFLTEDTCCFFDRDDSIGIVQGLPFIKLDANHKIGNVLSSFKTQLDKRNRVVNILDNIQNPSNYLACGFFLKIAKDNEITKLSRADAFKAILANTFLHHPLNMNTEEEIEIFKKIGFLTKKIDFYEIHRLENNSFDFKKINKIISSYL